MVGEQSPTAKHQDNEKGSKESRFTHPQGAGRSIEQQGQRLPLHEY